MLLYPLPLRMRKKYLVVEVKLVLILGFPKPLAILSDCFGGTFSRDITDIGPYQECEMFDPVEVVPRPSPRTPSV